MKKSAVMCIDCGKRPPVPAHVYLPEDPRCEVCSQEHARQVAYVNRAFRNMLIRFTHTSGETHNI